MKLSAVAIVVSVSDNKQLFNSQLHNVKSERSNKIQEQHTAV